MLPIRFTATFGHEKKVVDISAPVLGPRGHHLYINNYYAGLMLKLHDDWVLHTNNFNLQWSDILVLGEIIEGNFF